MTTETTPPTTRRQGGARRRRDVQRAVHVVVGVAVLAQLYGGATMGPTGTLIVQLLVAPILVLSGLALWKGHQVSRTLRRWTARRA